MIIRKSLSSEITVSVNVSKRNLDVVAALILYWEYILVKVWFLIIYRVNFFKVHFVRNLHRRLYSNHCLHTSSISLYFNRISLTTTITWWARVQMHCMLIYWVVFDLLVWALLNNCRYWLIQVKPYPVVVLDNIAGRFIHLKLLGVGNVFFQFFIFIFLLCMLQVKSLSFYLFTLSFFPLFPFKLLYNQFAQRFHRLNLDLSRFLDVQKFVFAV